MTGKQWAGIALGGLAGLMFLGALRSPASMSSPNGIGALLLTVVLPAVGGVLLFRGVGVGDRARLDRLRQQTIDAEILNMAVAQAGKLTAVEVSVKLALSPESAKDVLDKLVEREIADLEITDDGVLVYTFHDAGKLGGKSTAKGILDA